MFLQTRQVSYVFRAKTKYEDMKMKGGKASANLVKARGSALISEGAPSAAPMYIIPKNTGIRKAATSLFNWFEGVLINARNERFIKGLNCLNNGVYPFNYFMLFPVKVVEFYWRVLF